MGDANFGYISWLRADAPFRLFYARVGSRLRDPGIFMTAGLSALNLGQVRSGHVGAFIEPLPFVALTEARALPRAHQ